MELLTKEKHKRLLRFDFKMAFKCYCRNHFFIVYTMFNFFMPFLLCLIGSCIENYGTLIVIIIGLTSSFFSVFNQLAILTSIAVSVQRIKTNHLISGQLNLGSQARADALLSSLTAAAIYGVIMMFLFVLTCGLYTTFSATYRNLNESHDGSIVLAWKFIGVTCPTILINFISDIFLIEIFITSGSFKASVYYTGIVIIQLLLATVLGFQTSWNILGLGIGVLAGSVIGIILYGADCFSHTNIVKLKARVEKQELKTTFKTTFKFSSRYIFGTILKAFLVLGIGLGLALSARDAWGAMLLARIVWYNIMYTCGCFGDAIILQANFTKAYFYIHMDKSLQVINFQKLQIILVAVIEFLMLLAACLLIPVIGDIYLKNPGVIGSAFNSVQVPEYQCTGWTINSWLNFPYNSNGIYPGIDDAESLFIKTGYVKGGSPTMIYLTIFIWTMALTKIMCYSPFYSRNEKKINIAMAYITPLFIILFVAAMGLGTMSMQQTVGNFFFGFQGFSFALFIVGIAMITIGFLAVVKSKQFFASDRFLEMYNKYVTAMNSMMANKSANNSPAANDTNSASSSSASSEANNNSNNVAGNEPINKNLVQNNNVAGNEPINKNLVQNNNNNNVAGNEPINKNLVQNNNVAGNEPINKNLVQNNSNVAGNEPINKNLVQNNNNNVASSNSPIINPVNNNVESMSSNNSTTTDDSNWLGDGQISLKTMETENF